VFPFPDFVCEGIFVCVDDSLYAVVHYSERLEGPEVASGVGEFFVFEEESVAEGAVEHEVGLHLLVLPKMIMKMNLRAG